MKHLRLYFALATLLLGSGVVCADVVPDGPLDSDDTPLEVGLVEAESLEFRLDLRAGMRETAGYEELTYGSHWDGDENAVAEVIIGNTNDVESVVAGSLQGEGIIRWICNERRTYELKHVTYTNGVVSEVLVASFRKLNDGAGYSIGYSGVYDALPHPAAVNLPLSADTTVEYSLAEEGPYAPEPFYFKDVVTTSVWCVITAPGRLPETNSVPVEITKAPLTIMANNVDAISPGDDVVNNGVRYTGFVGGDNENTPDLFTGTLTFDYGGYDKDHPLSGNYVVTPGGLESANYEITYVPCMLEVRPENILSSESAVFKLDLRTGVRETSGFEVLTYGSAWSGEENSTVDVIVGRTNEVERVLARGMQGEGTLRWICLEPRTYTLSHVTYAGGEVTDVLMASFRLPEGADNLGIGYVNEYDGASHPVTTRVAMSPGAQVEYSLSEEGPYSPQPFSFKNPVETTVWYVITEPGSLPVTNTLFVQITKAPLTIAMKSINPLSAGDEPVNNGVRYSGFVGDDNESTPGIFSGNLTFDYGGYDSNNAVPGFYTVTPGGLTSQAYEITYVPGKMEVIPDSVVSAQSSEFKLDLRTGTRETSGYEDLTYGSLWSGNGYSTVKITVGEGDEVESVIASDLRGEGIVRWVSLEPRTYTLNHVTYSNGAASETLTARFRLSEGADNLAIGYTNVYDGAYHPITLRVPVSPNAIIKYSPTREGVYTPEVPQFKDVTDMLVWYEITESGSLPVTNCVIVKIAKAPLTISANYIYPIQCGDAPVNNGVRYSGFVGGDNESTPGMFSGALTFDYGGYSAEGVTSGNYVVTPGGLESANYEITYVPTTMVVNPATVVTAESEEFKLDLRTEPRESSGVEELPFNANWGSVPGDAVYVFEGEDDPPQVNPMWGLALSSGSTTLTLSGRGVVTVQHAIYKSGFLVDVLKAQFLVPQSEEHLPTIEYTAENYIGKYDGMPHGITVTAPPGATVTYSTAFNGIGSYSPICPTLTEIGSKNVWYRIEMPGHETVTGMAAILITEGSLEYWCKDIYETYCGGDGYTLNPEVTNPASGYTIKYSTSSEGPWSTSMKFINVCTNMPVYYVISAHGYETETNRAFVTILPKPLTLTSPTVTNFYNGSTWRLNTDDIVADGYVAGEKLAYATSAQIRDVGEVDATFTAYDMGAVVKASNYDITYNYGKLVVVEKVAPQKPIINLPDSRQDFVSKSAVIIDCAEKDAEIYYSISSSSSTTPTMATGTRYVAPFQITSSVYVSAIAVKYGLSSEVARAYFRKVDLTNETAAGAGGVTFAVGGETQWSAVLDSNAASGGACLRSGAIGDNQESWVETTVYGAGTFSFKWKVSCEWDDYYFWEWDHLKVETNGVMVACIDGETDWNEMSFEFAGGANTVRWTYVKDDVETDGEDCGWIDDVTWESSDVLTSPAVAGDAGALTSGSALLGYTIKTTTDKPDIQLLLPPDVDPGKVTIEVSSSAKHVKAAGASLKIVNAGYDVTPLVNIPGADSYGYVDLTKATVKEEIVKETLDPAKGGSFKVAADGTPTLTTAPTRPGLVYTLREGEELGSMVYGDSKVGDGASWTPDVRVKGGKSGFYSVSVSIQERK